MKCPTCKGELYAHVGPKAGLYHCDTCGTCLPEGSNTENSSAEVTEVTFEEVKAEEAPKPARTRRKA